MTSEAPVLKLGEILPNVNLYVKRDALLPFCFGGNKVRIAQEFFCDMETRGAEYMIGYGNTRSNLTRALAFLASKRHKKCIIICRTEKDEEKTA